MFSFFSKKIYLKDLMEGFCDMHSHLLWGVDDGAANQELTTKLADGLADLGCEKVYLTPHIIYGLYDNQDEASLRARFAQTEKHKRIEFRLAAEYYLDEKFMDHVASDEPLLAMGNKHLLVEYGLQSNRVTHIDELFEVSISGYNIIIAHPERYMFLCEARNMHELNKLTSRKYALQLNLLSLLGVHGKNTQHMAEELLKEERYTFVGTDTHSMKYIERFEDGELSAKLAEPLKRLINNNKEILWR